MRILFLCSSHSLDDSRVTRKQAVSLSKNGHEVTVCAMKRNDYEEKSVKLIDIDQVAKNAKKSTNMNENYARLNRLRRLSVLYSYAKQTKPDLVVAHEFETAILAYLLRKLFNIPYVFDSHECYNETIRELVPFPFKALTEKIVVFCLKIISRNAEAVTVVSPATEVFFKELSAQTPVEVLHNSPILEYFPYNEEETSTLIIVHDGIFGYERGIIQILHALALVGNKVDFKFLILGTISRDARAAFDDEVERLGLKSAIDAPGELPWTEFGKVEATGQIGLICSQLNPNYMLSLSHKLYTYMACGLAVIGMKDSETDKILNRYNCGIGIDTASPEEIAKAIIYLSEHPEERKRMARNGRKAIEEELGWHRMEEKMKILYSEIERKLEKKEKSHFAKG
jgi:glycosyltransferase involved in cell wall biosynthesis